MDQWSENTNDNSQTENLPRQQSNLRWIRNPMAIAVMAAFILIVILSTVSYGYFKPNWFSSNNSSARSQILTATATQVSQPTATSGSIPTATTPTVIPTATSTTLVPTKPQPTSTPTPKPPASSTSTPTPMPTATPTPLSGPPPQLWGNRRILEPKYCMPTDATNNFFVCNLILEDIGSVNLQWNASSTMSSATFNPPNGVLTPNAQVEVLMTLPCVPSGTVYYTGPANQIAIPWGCSANQSPLTP